VSEPLLHTVLEVAEILRCHRAQVFKLIKDGKLKTAPRAGKHTMILRSSLIAWLESGTVAAARSSSRAPRNASWSPDGLDDLRI
jgi:excisionase family DNA binding protein